MKKFHQLPGTISVNKNVLFVKDHEGSKGYKIKRNPISYRLRICVVIPYWIP